MPGEGCTFSDPKLLPVPEELTVGVGRPADDSLWFTKPPGLGLGGKPTLPSVVGETLPCQCWRLPPPAMSAGDIDTHINSSPQFCQFYTQIGTKLNHTDYTFLFSEINNKQNKFVQQPIKQNLNWTSTINLNTPLIHKKKSHHRMYEQYRYIYYDSHGINYKQQPKLNNLVPLGKRQQKLTHIHGNSCKFNFSVLVVFHNPS